MPKGLIMNATRYQFLHRIMLFTTIISTIYCIGCSNIIDDILKDTGEPSNGDIDVIDDQWIIADMPIVEIEVLLAESDPVQVSVKVTGYLDGCTTHHETHLTREGNTITIQMTTIRPKDITCVAIVTEYQEQVFIGTLPVGDYKVIVNHVEQEFHVD